MRLFEHEDFEQAILAAVDHFGGRFRASAIEKDYYVTEALRAIAAYGRHHVIFKGGTSLSKGWNLIERFSEDVDIFLDPDSYSPRLSSKRGDKELKSLRDAVSNHPAFTFLPGESKTIGGLGRADRFAYPQHFEEPEIDARVLCESGTASGREPTEEVQIRSYLAQFLQETQTSLHADDETAFPMRLLHFRRTFVEKLFAIHSKVQLLLQRGQPLGSYARHYYDLFQLSQRPEVTSMLASEEYKEIKINYDQISREHYPRNHFCPEGMTFRESLALFPEKPLDDQLGEEYERQCKLLCYGPYPSWGQLKARSWSSNQLSRSPHRWQLEHSTVDITAMLMAAEKPRSAQELLAIPIPRPRAAR